VPWLDQNRNGIDAEFARWVTGIISVIHLFWRFGRPIYGPWITPVRREVPAEEGNEER